ncbi:MAG: DUF2339 domain-containing protein, partial [Chthoniobacterales bacterium]|nr:DUF2339 domain-containing protein [Chthoniobacterales bacterium]
MQDSVLTCLVFIIFGVVLLPFVLMISNARKIKALQSSMQKLSQRLAALELQTSEHAAAHSDATASPLTTVSAPVPSAPVPAASVAAVSPAVASIIGELPSRVETPEPPSPAPAKARPHVPIEWEAFMGVKLFSWVGGFALFLGVVFLVKYSFENNLITPAMRIVIGAVIGSGLIAAGWFTARRNYRVPGQSLCATGVLVLYADIFGAHAFYNLLSLAAAFVLMSIVTVVAFLLAVRLDAQVVVVLGLIGGFLTPPLLTTGQENPFRLFGYVALLNAGIAAVGLRKRWDYLFALAAAGTILTQWAWAFDFTVARANAGFLIFLLLEAQFLAFQYLRRKLPPPENWSTYAALVIGFSALAFAFCFVSYAELAARPAFLFSFTFLADIGLLALATTRANPSRIAGPAGAVVFALLAAWTSQYLTHPLLWWGLG